MTTPPANFDKRVAQYVALRDKIKEIGERQKAELEPFKALLEQLNGILLGHLNTVGAERVGTAHGTVYKTAKKSASVSDKSAFWAYVIAQGNFDLVDKSANKTAVEAHIAEHGTTPPGVNWNVIDVVGVQRASDK
jgi:hypothetical protein